MFENDNFKFYNTDCIEGAKKYIADNSVDLIVTDPPYGINGDRLHLHYNRDEGYVIDGYVEIPKKEYPEFSLKWILEAERILKPGGSIYIVSGYTNLIHILNALSKTGLQEVNHIIWKYNFGVWTKNKYISSHYHILYYVKKGEKRTFNSFCRYGTGEKDEKSGALNYKDREDVWTINKEFKHNRIKNKNELPKELLSKLILYSSNENDVVCDLFLGSFSTAKVAVGLNRKVVGFEINKNSFDYQLENIKKLEPGYLIPELRIPEHIVYDNQRKPWKEKDLENIVVAYKKMKREKMSKREIIYKLSKDYGRGYFAILNVIKNYQ